jgi:hypothetical protein
MRAILLASAPAQAGSLGYPRCVTFPSPCTRALTGACIAMLLGTACGATTVTVTPSSSTSHAASPSAAPQAFAGTGFRTKVPAGWQDQTTNQTAVSSLGGSGTVLMLLASPDHGLVAVRTTPQPVADDQLAHYLTTVTPPGASGVSHAEPVDIDGRSGVLITCMVVPASGAAQENEAMVVNQAGNTYEILLSTAQAGFARDAAGLQEILNSWTWA